MTRSEIGQVKFSGYYHAFSWDAPQVRGLGASDEGDWRLVWPPPHHAPGPPWVGPAPEGRARATPHAPAAVAARSGQADLACCVAWDAWWLGSALWAGGDERQWRLSRDPTSRPGELTGELTVRTRSG